MDTDELRRAFAQSFSGRAATACPEPAELWDAIEARLPVERRRAIADHLAECRIRAALAGLSRSLNRGRGDVAEAFDQFGILEIIGHRRLGGRVREATIGGIPLIRIDVFRDGDEPVTQYYGPSAIFCLTPASEEAAQAASIFVAPVGEFTVQAKANAQVVEALEEALAALRDAEWKGVRSVTGEPCCPVCEALEETGEHAEDCALSASLGGNDIHF